ncbi:class I glutamine amidotransferase-like protein [Sarocladium strictum]
MDTFNASLSKVPEVLGLAKHAKSDAQPGLLFLGGGGSAADEADLWNEAFQPGQRIVIWPFAQPRERWAGTLAWFTGALAARSELSSFGSITMADMVPGGGLDAADILVVPGGNTFELLAILRSQGLLDNLRDFIERGGKYYGGSAGAVLVGADIGLIDVERGAFDENTVGLQDTQGLALMGDITVFPHWEPQVGPAEHEAWSREKNLRVLCTPEKSGVVIDLAGRTGTNKGPLDVTLFSPDGHRQTIKPEESFTF